MEELLNWPPVPGARIEHGKRKADVLQSARCTWFFQRILETAVLGQNQTVAVLLHSSH